MNLTDIGNSEYSNKLQELVDKIECINKEFCGNGAGLTKGQFLEKLFVEFLIDNFPNCCSYNNKKCEQADFCINDKYYSLKNLSQAGDLALSWSRVNKTHIPKKVDIDIVIIVSTSGKWWKIGPKDSFGKTINGYNKCIKKGMYIIDKQWCQDIIYKSNNKTSYLIDKKTIYKLLRKAYRHKMFVKFPNQKNNLEFKIINAFVEMEDD